MDFQEIDENHSLIDENEIYDVLKRLDIVYEKIDHKAVFTMEEYQFIEEQMDVTIVKNLFLANRQQKKFYLLLIQGDKPFKTKEISSQINSPRLSFGNEEKLYETLHCHPGSISVFGLFFDQENQVQLLIDEDLLNKEYLGFHPCVNTSTIKIKTQDLLLKFLPYVNHSYLKVKLGKKI